MRSLQQLKIMRAELSVQELIDRLFEAVGEGREEFVHLLVDYGAPVDSKDSDGRTPLLRAAMEGHKAIVRLLLGTNRVDVNAKDNDGRTPLLWAAKKGHEAVVGLLLRANKVDVDVKDNDGLTPVIWAAENRHHAITNQLLDTGKAKPHFVDYIDGRPTRWIFLRT
ncbi:MAG: hypothetical protein M1821_000830 [Bathelium mastoideum]|nr:MAG: hypothetical protein M1821_000830 [Bathelium mastoideum]